jgi:Zn-finger nucleic acid-binding protein
MKCPACKNPLREKGASGMTVDICYGGCGGIWFDPSELERVDARGAATLHTIWQAPPGKPAKLTESRLCPRCANQALERRWFSDLKRVEIDQCPKCGGVWLDAGEFTRIREEIGGDRLAPPGWIAAMAAAADAVANAEGARQPRL